MTLVALQWHYQRAVLTRVAFLTLFTPYSILEKILFLKYPMNLTSITQLLGNSVCVATSNCIGNVNYSLLRAPVASARYDRILPHYLVYKVIITLTST